MARRHRGGHRAKGLFNSGLPKVGDMVSAAYGGKKLGAFEALGVLTDETKTTGERLEGAYQAVASRVTSIGPVVTTVVGLVIVNTGIKLCRKVGGKWVRKWL